MIHTFQAVYTDSDMQAVVNVMKSGWTITGKECAAFEQEFAEYIGVRYAVMTSSCTHALQLAYMILRPPHVFTTPLTFCATINSLVHARIPFDFVDVDTNGNMLPTTGWCVPVHFAGRPITWSPDHAIYDAAHAAGGWVPFGKVGSYGEATAFSFHVSKCFNTFQGGCLTTNDTLLAQKARTLRLHGMTKDAFARDREKTALYDVEEIGLKANMTDIQAAVGREQLKRLDVLNEARHFLALRYLKELKGDRLELPQDVEGHTWHLFIVKLRPEWTSSRDAVIETCMSQGVELAIHVKPVHLLSAYQSLGFREGQYPQAEDFWRRAITLPLYPTLSFKDQTRVIEVVSHAIKSL